MPSTEQIKYVDEFCTPIRRIETPDGRGELTNVVLENQPDLRITGNGTLQHPLRVVASGVYGAAPKMERVLLMLADWLDDGGCLPSPSALMPDSDEETVEQAIRAALLA